MSKIAGGQDCPQCGDSDTKGDESIIELIDQTPQAYKLGGVVTVFAMTGLQFWGPKIPILNLGVMQQVVDTTSPMFYFVYILFVPAFIVLGKYAGAVFWSVMPAGESK